MLLGTIEVRLEADLLLVEHVHGRVRAGEHVLGIAHAGLRPLLIVKINIKLKFYTHC